MNLTGKQVRAARALAGWDRPDLAERVGMSLMTIQNIELETKRPKQKTLDKIIAAFDEVGIEFTENQGVRCKPSNLEIFEGISRFQEFTEFVYQHLLKNGGEVCISAVDETQFQKYRRNVEQYRERMTELVNRGDVSVRILTSKSTFVPYFSQMKWQPPQSATPTSFYAFGNCLALISFEHNPAPYVVLHKAGPFAEAYKQAFEIAWQNAKDPSERPQ
jgi:transcriptional regulator with XRE-family HTH domain